MVIKPEYINDKVNIHDLLPLSFLKKNPYTGSKGKLRYRIEKAEVEVVVDPEPAPAPEKSEAAPEKSEALPEKPEAAPEKPAAEPEIRIEKILRCTTWFTPFAFDKTPDEEKACREFAFSDKGIEDIIVYLNECLENGGNKGGDQ